VESIRGSRLIGIDDFFVGPKRNAMGGDELIRAVHIPVAAGPQQFAKIGQRNAMVIATVSFALSIDVAARRVGTGIGSAGPTPLRAAAAEAMLEAALTWDSPEPLDHSLADEFGRLVANAASPIDDVRGTAVYRRHALSVLGRRLLGWVWAELGNGGP
jgi:CO/xanthine dehydrogenase FAD-binding subunit